MAFKVRCKISFFFFVKPAVRVHFMPFTAKRRLAEPSLLSLSSLLTLETRQLNSPTYYYLADRPTWDFRHYHTCAILSSRTKNLREYNFADQPNSHTHANPPTWTWGKVCVGRILSTSCDFFHLKIFAIQRRILAINDQSFKGWGDQTKQHNQDLRAQKSSDFVRKLYSKCQLSQ